MVCASVQFLPHHSRLAYMKGEKQMDYETRLRKMDEHLSNHPHDYQTVIARMKTYSEAVDADIRRAQNIRLARLAEVRRQRKERRDAKKQDD